jgi:hypothetical protein
LCHLLLKWIGIDPIGTSVSPRQRYAAVKFGGAVFSSFDRKPDKLFSIRIRRDALPMAKRICRTADPFDPTRMPRPRRGVRRVPPPSPTAVVHEILQWRPHASILGEGCAGLACRRTGRADPLSPHSRRAAPPICPDLIFDRHNALLTQKGWIVCDGQTKLIEFNRKSVALRTAHNAEKLLRTNEAAERKKAEPISAGKLTIAG